MKVFKFRLQKLLQIKKHQKLEKQKELAKAERVRRMEEAHLDNLHHKMAGELVDLKNAQGRTLDVTRFVRSVYYQQRLLQNMATQEKVIAGAREKEAEKREQLLEASKQEKIFLKLKERQQERYLKDLELRDQKDTDEIAKNVSLRIETL